MATQRISPSTMSLSSRRRHAHLGLLSTLLLIVAIIFLGPVSLVTWAQTTRTVRMVVPLPAGGAGDILARLLAEQVGQANGISTVVENRPGAGSVIGTEAVARAHPDGNTLLVNAPYLLIAPHVRKLNYDPLTSFEPICYLVSSPAVLVVNSASPHRTLPDLLNAARARPGELTLASVGPGTAQHIGLEMLKRAANVNLTYVPYPGGAPAISALLGEHVTAVMAEYAPVAELLKTGKLRALATGSPRRIEPLPELPTVSEWGYKDYEVDLWWGLFAPAKTPNEIVSQLAGWFTSAMQAPEVKSKLVLRGFYPVAMCGGEFGALLRKQYDYYGRVVREASIKGE